jgi:hypothetical protein
MPKINAVFTRSPIVQKKCQKKILLARPLVGACRQAIFVKHTQLCFVLWTFRLPAGSYKVGWALHAGALSTSDSERNTLNRVRTFFNQYAHNYLVFAHNCSFFPDEGGAYRFFVA